MISLIRRALNFLKNKGLKLFVKQIFISLSHRLGISIKIHPLARTRGLHKARKIFNNRKLIYIEDGYWMLEPMPTKDELNEYYSNVYWGSWLDRDYGVKLRDFFHFNLIEKYLPEFNSSPKKILNFGAGDGGISFLFHQKGHHICNVEPSSLINIFDNRWETFNDMDSVKDYDYDLIYGRHSLEHISDLDNFLLQVQKRLSKDSYVFWEVPNADNPLNGPLENTISVPHTYYFQKKFFEKEFKDIIFSTCYDAEQAHVSKFSDWDQFINDKGDCLMVLGKY